MGAGVIVKARDRTEQDEADSAGKRFRGPRLTASLVALAAAVLLFALIALDVAAGGNATLIDVRLSNWLHTHSTPTLTAIFSFISAIHSGWIVSIVTLAICAYLWTRRQRDWVLTFLLAVFVGMLLNVGLKHLFERLRPSFPDTIQRFATFSFPSGHTMLATAFYGTLCLFVISRVKALRWQVLAVLMGGVMIGLVGFSRVYIGAHYLSDVLAAIAEGLAWVAVCAITVQRCRLLSKWHSARSAR